MAVTKMLRAGTRLLVVAAIVVTIVVGSFPRRGVAAARKPIKLEIAFHVADFEGKPVADDAFLDKRLARTNQIYAAYGVSFTRSGSTKLDERYARLTDRAGRDALAREVSPRRRGVIDCFVVRSFKDLGDPLIYRRGVHWHVKSRPGCHFIILSAFGDVDVLAHELGHFLGNPQHRWVAGNLMSYARGNDPVLDEDQLRRLEAALRGYLGRRELRAVSSTGPLAADQAAGL